MAANPAFIARTRNPDLPSPTRWEPTAKVPGSIDLYAEMEAERRAKWRRNREVGRG